MTVRRIPLLLTAAVSAGGALALLAAFPARAEHFDIFLTLTSAEGRAESGWDTSPPEGGVNPRQVVTAHPGEELLLDWRLRSEFPHGIMKGTTIRIFAAPEAEIGQKPVPSPTVPRVVDNSFTADFLPHHSAHGLLHFRVPEKGSYLVRLESEETLKEHGHEHFAAVDLKVE